MKIVGAKCEGCGKTEQMSVDPQVTDVLPPGWLSRQIVDAYCMPPSLLYPEGRRVEGDKHLLHYCGECQPTAAPPVDPDLLAYVRRVEEQARASGVAGDTTEGTSERAA